MRKQQQPATHIAVEQNNKQGEIAMKKHLNQNLRISRICVAILAVALLCSLACEEKEKAKTEADEVAKTETEALAKAKAEAEEVEAQMAIAAELATAEAAAKAAEAFAKETRAAAKIKCTSPGNSSEQTDGVKLLECITDDNGKVQKKFEYDGQNRIVKICYLGDDGKTLSATNTIVYAKNLVTIENISSNNSYVTKYVKNGNTITLEDVETLTVNEDGYVVRIDKESGDGWSTNYYYEAGNLIFSPAQVDVSSEEQKYSYDNKKSPFSNSNTPKWLFGVLLGDFSYASKNNVLEESWSGTVATGNAEYKYEYDSDGFPTNQTLKVHGDTKITRFIYSGGMKN
jgi:hypothetical protein